jgi:hypothetical protein
MKDELIATACVCCGCSSIAKSPAVLMPFVADRAFGWAPVNIDSSWGLQTIPEGRAYSLCNSLFCRDCGLIFLDIRFDDGALSRLYTGYRDEEYTLMREAYEPGYRIRNEGFQHCISYLDDVENFLRPLLPKTLSVLDWGGDTGVNTPFKYGGNSIHVFDISEVESIPGVSRVNLEEALEHSYDLVVCSNVLEHTPYPVVMLSEISKVMNRNSVLYLEVPYEVHMRTYTTGTERLLAKRHWHEHVNFFTDRALQSLVQSSGFEVIKFEDKKISSTESEFYQFFVACKLAEQKC